MKLALVILGACTAFMAALFVAVVVIVMLDPTNPPAPVDAQGTEPAATTVPASDPTPTPAPEPEPTPDSSIERIRQSLSAAELQAGKFKCYQDNVLHMHAIDGSWSERDSQRKYDRRAVIENNGLLRGICQDLYDYEWNYSYMDEYIDPWVYQEFGITPPY